MAIDLLRKNSSSLFRHQALHQNQTAAPKIVHTQQADCKLGPHSRGALHTMDTTDAPQMMEHIHKSITFTPNDTRWVPCSARFVVTGIHPRAKGALVVRFLGVQQAGSSADLRILVVSTVHISALASNGWRPWQLWSHDQGLWIRLPWIIRLFCPVWCLFRTELQYNVAK